MMAQRSTFLAQMNKSQDDVRATKRYRTPEGPSQKWWLGPLPSKEQYEERYGLGNGNDLYLLSELRAVHHPSYHMFLRRLAWRHHRLLSRLFIIAASCLWVIYVYRYQIALGWPALDASGELSLRELSLRRRFHTALVFSTICRSSWRSTEPRILMTRHRGGSEGRGRCDFLFGA